MLEPVVASNPCSDEPNADDDVISDDDATDDAADVICAACAVLFNSSMAADVGRLLNAWLIIEASFCAASMSLISCALCCAVDELSAAVCATGSEAALVCAKPELVILFVLVPLLLVVDTERMGAWEETAGEVIDGSDICCCCCCCGCGGGVCRNPAAAYWRKVSWTLCKNPLTVAYCCCCCCCGCWCCLCCCCCWLVAWLAVTSLVDVFSVLSILLGETRSNWSTVNRKTRWLHGF